MEQDNDENTHALLQVQKCYICKRALDEVKDYMGQGNRHLNIEMEDCGGDYLVPICPICSDVIHNISHEPWMDNELLDEAFTDFINRNKRRQKIQAIQGRGDFYTQFHHLYSNLPPEHQKAALPLVGKQIDILDKAKAEIEQDLANAACLRKDAGEAEWHKESYLLFKEWFKKWFGKPF